MKITYIAEIGTNHNGDATLAERMVDAAARAGADYVKFQIWRAENFVERSSVYWDDFVRESLDFDVYARLRDRARRRGCRFLATPFDPESLLLLKRLGGDAIKIASGDMNNYALLDRVAALRRRLLVSLGAATLPEIDATVSFLRRRRAPFSLLHCALSYPARFEELNLGFLPVLRERYRCPVGFSDHSPGVAGSLAAIALGATIVEKHFTIDRSLPGGDNSMSVLPEEFARLRREGDQVAAALGARRPIISPAQAKLKSLVRRKLFAARDIVQGRPIRADDVLALRPQPGRRALGAERYPWLLGRRPRRPIKSGQPITAGMVRP